MDTFRDELSNKQYRLIDEFGMESIALKAARTASLNASFEIVMSAMSLADISSFQSYMKPLMQGFHHDIDFL